MLHVSLGLGEAKNFPSQSYNISKFRTPARKVSLDQGCIVAGGSTARPARGQPGSEPPARPARTQPGSEHVAAGIVAVG